eukprot:147593_1
MPRKRNKHATKKKGNTNSYGHELRMFEITTDTLSTCDKMMTYCQQRPWFPMNILYHANAGSSNRRGKRKDKLGLRAAIVGELKSMLRNDIKPKLKTFIREATGAPPQEIVTVLNKSDMTFIPSAEMIQKWGDRGYQFGQIMELITSRNLGMLEELDFSAGVWQSLLSIHSAIGKGEIQWINSDSDSDSDSDSEEQLQILNQNIKSIKRRGKKRKLTHKRTDTCSEPVNKKRKLTDTYSYDTNNNNNNSNSNNNNNNSNNNHNNSNSKWKVQHVTRRQNEGASNHHIRQRMENKHPYLKGKDEHDFMIYEFLAPNDPIRETPIVSGSAGDEYIYDTRSRHFEYDKITFKRFMLHPHSLTYMHPRMIAQHHTTQYGLRNTRIPDATIERIRISGSGEFRLGALISEHLLLTKRIHTEQMAYEFNQKLIETDNRFGDLKVGYNEPTEQSCRLPRSKEYIVRQKEQNKYKSCRTLWFIRNNILTLPERLGADKWEQTRKLWKVFGVFEWLGILIRRFFPGCESLAVENGLLKEEDFEKINVLDNNDIDEPKESMIDLESYL